jgi:hypothetical protein
MNPTLKADDKTSLIADNKTPPMTISRIKASATDTALLIGKTAPLLNRLVMNGKISQAQIISPKGMHSIIDKMT